MGYSALFRIALGDLLPDGKVKNKSLLRFCEDTAGFHSDAVGDGFRYRYSLGTVWIIMEWQLAVYSRPGYGETVKVETWNCGREKAHVWHGFNLTAADGTLIAEAYAKLCLMEMEKRRLVRIPAGVDEQYGNGPERKPFMLQMHFSAMTEADREYSAVICRSSTDVYGHLHNLGYWDLAEELLPSEVLGKTPCLIGLRFKNELSGGDTAQCQLFHTEDGEWILIKKDAVISAEIILK